MDEGLLRHFILNSLRAYNSKYQKEYGEMIIACDDKNYWRKDVFPYYKASRKKDRDSSALDWGSIFECLHKIRDEIKEFFPYRVIQVDKAEADDIIGTLCLKFGNTHEKILIVSGDKDFRQLQAFMNVKQYDPTRKKWMEEKHQSAFLKEHIMRGDSSDGVPNFLSPDDVFMVNGRQKSIMQKNVAKWIYQEPEQFCDEVMLRGWKRNEQMIDLTLIPNDIQDRIMVNYEAEAGKNKSRLFNYFIEKKLKNLLTDIGSF